MIVAPAKLSGRDRSVAIRLIGNLLGNFPNVGIPVLCRICGVQQIAILH